jgi:hypothetical protein
MNAKLKYVCLAALLPLVFSGCAGMASMGDKMNMRDISHDAQAKEYEPVLAFHVAATAKLREVAKGADGKDALVYAPTSCKFTNGKWNEEFRNKPSTFYGKCNAAGYAEGFGGIFLNLGDGKFGSPLFGFGYGGGKDHPAYVGNFKSGQPQGEGYLTVSVPTKSLLGPLYLVDTNVSAEEWLSDYKKLLAASPQQGQQIPPDSTLLAQYRSSREESIKRLSTMSATLRIPSYVGGFENGEPSGKGVIFSSSDHLVYAGEMKDGKRNGFGRSYTPAFFELNGQHASAKQLTQIAAEGSFKDDKLNGTCTAIYTQCKRVTANFQNGELKPGYAIFTEPTRQDQEKSFTHTSATTGVYKPVYVYGETLTVYTNGTLQPQLRGFVSRKWEDDDFFYSFTGNADEQGKWDGEVVASKRPKSFGDVTNHKSMMLGSGGEKVYRATFKHGEEQKQPEGAAAKQGELVDLIGKLIKSRNPSVDSVAIAKGMTSIMSTMIVGALGDPCTDLGEMSANVRDKFDQTSKYLDALATLPGKGR